MKFYSTKNKSLKKSFREATLIGLPSDNGLFMPEYIPDLSSLVKGINNLSIHIPPSITKACPPNI